MRVDLAGPKSRQQIVACCGKELLLHQIENLQRSHDVDDIAIDLQARRLVVPCLAGQNRLDQMAHDRHQAKLSLLIDIVTQ
ncbi:hypothetical protein [Agrobacterium rosae]|uniref:hypothetical protein n=1 Tax=Agrobacterium rosae TaxID=1972867 RepID=UPI003B9EBCF8